MRVVCLCSEITKSMDLPQNMIDQISKYALGESFSFNYNWEELSFRSEFQEKVLRACAKIPYGETKTYAEIAQEIGHSGAARAVGTALKHNPYPIVIPCHRVVRSSGGYGEYAFGGESKRQLIEFEQKNLQQKS